MYLLPSLPPTQIFTDSSGYGCGIVVAAVLRRPGRKDVVWQFYLGPDWHHTVYKGELVGILLILSLISTQKVYNDILCLQIFKLPCKPSMVAKRDQEVTFSTK